LLSLAGCASQASQPAAAPRAVVEAPKHKRPALPTPADILASQPPFVQQAIKNKAGSARWPTYHHGSTIIYPYDADSTPVVSAAALRTTDVQLEGGETVTDVALGDAQRWMASAASAGDPHNATPHIVVKPEISGIDTNLTVYTTRRIYHLELRARGRAAQEVEFYYPDDTLREMAQAEQALKEQSSRAEDTAEANAQTALPDVDPSRLNFAYKIDGAHVSWTPQGAFDDGTRVYLQMPGSMSNAPAPALMVDGQGGRQMVNYRVVPAGSDGGAYYVVDRLFDKAELISGVGRDQDRVTVTYSGAAR
jgi:type IV secretion system protein VirB9